MLTTDRVSGIALVVFSLLVIWQSRLLPLGTFHQPGPAYIPILLALFLLIFGVCLALTGRRPPLLSSLSWTEWRHALVILAVCVFAVLGMERLGYRVTMLLVLSVLLRIMEKCGRVLTVAFALFLSLGSFFLFHTILRVPLPRGTLGF
jgi:tripartite tricarboxylate transporter TctB family protein